MIKFTINTSELKTALSIVSLGTDDTLENTRSHALFVIKDGRAHVYATNEDKIATSSMAADTQENTQFTASPKKVLTLISSTNKETITFSYEDTTKTLNVYASEDPDAFISFASFDPGTFLSFDKELQAQTDVKKIYTEVFLIGLKFIQGFLPKDDKDKKYSNLYINNSLFCGSNGSTKIGILKCQDLEGIDSVSLRRAMLPGIITFIDKIETPELQIRNSKKFITFFSSDNTHCFGFKKTTMEIPNLPLVTKVPETDGFNIDCDKLTKKLNRLMLASPENFGIKFKLNGDVLSMETVTDRVSYEKINCRRIGKSVNDLEFIMESGFLQKILNSYEAADVDIYIEGQRCIIHSSASILIEKTDEKRPFTAIGLLTQAQIV